MVAARTIRRKALLAMFFASGMVASQVPVTASTGTDGAVSVVQGIFDNPELQAEVRAFYLLKVAECYLPNAQSVDVEASFGSLRHGADIGLSRTVDKLLGNWAAELEPQRPAAVASTKRTPKGKATDAVANDKGDSHALANLAIEKALVQINRSPDLAAKMPVYFIAAQMFNKFGETKRAAACDEALSKMVRDCELETPPREADVAAAVAILNLRSYQYIDVRIPDDKVATTTSSASQPIPDFSQADFQKCEALKLLGVEMADRLKATSHTRRKVHRDLALWYERLGKSELAAKEKAALFGLVGFNSEDLLYPQSVGCGHVVWWTRHSNLRMGCGMG